MIYFLEEEGLFNDAIRDIFAAINNGIYTLIANTYNLIEDLARISILSYGDMKEFAQRIYALLGLFMLFKLSFSIVTYIIDPGKMSDRTAGMGAIIKNVIITFVLILIVPTCFSLLYEAQDAILSDNVIPKLLLGKSSDTADIKGDGDFAKFNIAPDYCKNSFDVATNGQYISLMILRPFFQPAHDVETFKEKPVYSAYCSVGLGDLWMLSTTSIYFGKAFNVKSTSFFLANSNIYNAANGTDGLFRWSDYDIDFNYFISLLVGIGVELILLNIALEVAIRSVKLAFLQLISPIPIVSYIDPKSGKDGMFKKWYTEVFKTWTSLFIRLLAVFFGVYLIQKLNENDSLYLLSGNANSIKSGNTWIMLFLMIGILMFMKQIPSLLESLIPGMKGAGSFKLNPIKNIRENALGGKMLTGAALGGAAMIGAAGGSAIANTWAAKANGKSWKDSLKSGGTGLFTGGYYGAKNGMRNGYNGKYRGTILNSVKENSKYRNKTDDIKKANAEAGIRDHVPFKVARQSLRDEVNEVIGKKQSSGTTGIIKDQIKQAEMKLENTKRDEEAAAVAMANIRSDKGGIKAGMYTRAFKSDVIKNEETGQYEYKKMNGDSYRHWMANEIGTEEFAKVKTDVQSSLQSDPNYQQLSEEQRKQMIENELEKQLSIKHGNSHLTREEYDNYNALWSDRNVADLEGRKLNKEITNKKELYGKQNSKKG